MNRKRSENVKNSMSIDYLLIRLIICRISAKSGRSVGSSSQQRFINCSISLVHSPSSIVGRSKLPDFTLSTISIQNQISQIQFFISVNSPFDVNSKSRK